MRRLFKVGKDRGIHHSLWKCSYAISRYIFITGSCTLQLVKTADSLLTANRRICDTFTFIKPVLGCIRTSGVKENTWCTSLEGLITSSFLSLHFRVLLCSPPLLAFCLDCSLSGLHYTGCPSLKLRLLWTRAQSFFRSTLNLRQPRSSPFVCLAGFCTW